MNVRETLQLRVARTRERNCATFTESAQHPAQPERNLDRISRAKASEKCATDKATELQPSSCAAVAHEEFVEPPSYEGTGWRLAGGEGLSVETLARFYAASQALNRSH